VSDPERRRRARRFSQAISEGDGISLIPLLRGESGPLARAVEAAGAEALAVDTVAGVAALRPDTELPLLVRMLEGSVGALESASDAGADACVLQYEPLADDEGVLEELLHTAWELGLEIALDVRDEDELEEALERLDPDILLICERDPDKGEPEFERTLDLLADVPAGKLVVSESRVRTRDQVLELERAGVDAVVLETPGAMAQELVSELTGRSQTL
jgi:indole-3-glycerol phosphate synthase